MNKKKYLRVVIEVAIAIIILIGFAFFNNHISSVRSYSFDYINDSYEYAYQAERVYVDGDYFVIDGWFFELNSKRNISADIKNKEIGIIIYDLNSTQNVNLEEKNINHYEGLALDVKRTVREDINNYFKCDYDYSKCGFEAKIEKSKIDLQEGKYHLIIKPDQTSFEGIDTDIFIDCGKLKYVNPSDEIDLNLKGTDIEDVIKEGYCLASIPQKHITIYQYNMKLYYIADSLYDFKGDGKTIIEYMIDTTQFDKLPKSRTEAGIFWDNIGGRFEDYEITDTLNCGEYRVSVRDIPADYAVTKIETGNYVEGKWIWRKIVRPVYLYKEQIMDEQG